MDELELERKREAYVDALAFLVEEELDGQPRELRREMTDEDFAAIARLVESGDLTEDQLVERGYMTSGRFEELRTALLDGKPLEEAAILIEIGYEDVLERVLERTLERRTRD